MLSVTGLSKFFGGIRAISDVSFNVDAGEVFGLIGPNGSGKTTTINVLTGVYRATSGSVRFFGQELAHKRPDEITRAGISRTFQNLRLFPSLTVLGNVLTAQTFRCNSMVTRFSAFPSAEDRGLRWEAMELLERFGLLSRANWPATALSYGERKRLEIARALATKSPLLLLDEPAAGMNPVELDWMKAMISEVRSSGVAVILIEHHMKLVMSVCDRVAVLNFGQKICEGTPSQVTADPLVIEAYLGKEVQ